MEYRRFENTIIARIDRGEEITEQVRRVAERENIKLAAVNALGAVGEFTVGVFDVGQKKYFAREFAGYYEIVSLHGTINTFNGEYYSHLHMSAGTVEGALVGGHLNRAVVSATCEMVITVIDGRVDRRYDDAVGLNVFEF